MRKRATKSTLTELVCALCKDYSRRNGLMSCNSTSRRVKNELVYINMRVFEAVSEIVGSECAEVMIYDIGNSIGYAKTELYCFSEGSYKKYKREAVQNIAKRLFLCD